MVDIIMSCYFPVDVSERQEYAKQCVSELCANVLASCAPRLILADDSEIPDDELMLELAELAHLDTIWTRSYHHGIGASLNKALEQVLSTDSWMYTTDDWLLLKELDLDGPISLLRLGYDMVRLGPVHPDLQCVTRFQAGLGWWLDLRQEYGGFCFATRPFIATKAWYDKMGPFDEGLNSYETERLYAERVAKSTSKLAYWSGIDLAGPWQHVGDVNVGYRDV